jgi:lysophospholipase L1-like esterase
MIGTNDIGSGVSKEEIVNNIKKIISMIKEKKPNTKIYLETIYPVNNNKRKQDNMRNNKIISDINNELKEYCENSDIYFIDVYSHLVDESNMLKDEYTGDGLHLNNLGYEEVTKVLKPYIDE